MVLKKINFDYHTKHVYGENSVAWAVSPEDLIRKAGRSASPVLILGDKIFPTSKNDPFLSFKKARKCETKVLLLPHVEFCDVRIEDERGDIKGIFDSPLAKLKCPENAEEAIERIVELGGIPVISPQYERISEKNVTRLYNKFSKYTVYLDLNWWLPDEPIRNLATQLEAPLVAAADSYRAQGLDRIYNLTEGRMEKPEDVIEVLRRKQITPQVVAPPSKLDLMERTYHLLIDNLKAGSFYNISRLMKYGLTRYLFSR